MPWKTYGKKRKPLLPSTQLFDVEGEGTDSPPQKLRKLTSDAPTSARALNSRVPLLDFISPPSNEIDGLGDALLASSPVGSDHSSSMKSIEPAMERRVSLLLRGESPPKTSTKALRPPSEFLRPPPETPAAPPAGQGDDTTNIGSASHRRMSSIAGFGLSRMKPSHIISSVPSPAGGRAADLGHRVSALVNRPATPQDSSISNLYFDTPPKSSPPVKPSPNVKSPTEVKLGMGRRMIERAKSAVTRSPLTPKRSIKNKGKGREKFLEQTMLLSGAGTSGESTVYSPSSLFFDAPDVPTEPWMPTERTRVPSRPITHESMHSGHLEASTFTVRSPLVERTALELPAIDHAMENIETGRTPKFHLALSTNPREGKRLSMIESVTEKPPVYIRRSLESATSNTVSSSASRATDHELRRSTAKIKRGSLLAASSNDSESVRSNKPRIGHKAANTSSSMFKASISISRGSLRKDRDRTILAEKDTNRKLAPEDDGAVKIARAMKVSVSPKVKEVFNRLPNRRTHTKPPRSTGFALPRSSSKASHVLGHHVGSKEPLRPPRGDQVTVTSMRDNSSSDDELA